MTDNTQPTTDLLLYDMGALYRKKLLKPMRPYIVGESLEGVSVNAEDTPEHGGMVAWNPDNPADKWYIAKRFFEDNYELAVEKPPTPALSGDVEAAFDTLRSYHVTHSPMNGAEITYDAEAHEALSTLRATITDLTAENARLTEHIAEQNRVVAEQLDRMRDQVSELQSAGSKMAHRLIAKHLPWREGTTHPRRVVLAYVQQLEQDAAQLNTYSERMEAVERGLRMAVRFMLSSGSEDSDMQAEWVRAGMPDMSAMPTDEAARIWYDHLATLDTTAPDTGRSCDE